MAVYYDRVKETTTKTGQFSTGVNDEYDLQGSSSGYVEFGDKLADTETCYFCVHSGDDWEVLLGVYDTSGNTLTATSLEASSDISGGLAIDWAAGSKDIFLVLPSTVIGGWNTLITSLQTTNENRIIGRADGVGTGVVGELTATKSVTVTASSNVELDGDDATPGNNKLYSTNGSGTKGWNDLPSHVHGNITNAGAIGSTTNLPIITTTSGVLTTGTFGTGANTFCVGNDSRLSDSRPPAGSAGGGLSGSYPNPTVAVVAAAAITSGTIDSARLPAASTSAAGIAELATSAETTAGLVVQASDTRLSDSRTPTSHTHTASEVTDFHVQTMRRVILWR